VRTVGSIWHGIGVLRNGARVLDGDMLGAWEAVSRGSAESHLGCRHAAAVWVDIGEDVGCAHCDGVEVMMSKRCIQSGPVGAYSSVKDG
jgi:hypothetical protein